MLKDHHNHSKQQCSIFIYNKTSILREKKKLWHQGDKIAREAVIPVQKPSMIRNNRPKQMRNHQVSTNHN